jgi:hypothetical protein
MNLAQAFGRDYRAPNIGWRGNRTGAARLFSARKASFPS